MSLRKTDFVRQRAFGEHSGGAKAPPRFCFGHVPASRLLSSGVIIAAFTLSAGCDESRAPTAPPTNPAAISIENIAATAIKNVAVVGPFTYRVSLTLREAADVGGVIAQVTAIVHDASGSSTEMHFSPAEAFGTTRFLPSGTLAASGITVLGLLETTREVAVRVSFVDDHLNAGSVETSLKVNADFSGDWSGPTTISQPPGDWSLIRISLVHRGTNLSGDLTTLDGRRFPVSGCVACDWAPGLSVGGLPTDSAGCAIGFVLPEFGFSAGQMRRIVGRLTGRCPGTAGGTATLDRT